MKTIDPYSSKNGFSSSTENYGDAAIGYVCSKRESAECTIRGRLCPEDRVKQKYYTVILQIDGKNDKIKSLECLD